MLSWNPSFPVLEASPQHSTDASTMWCQIPSRSSPNASSVPMSSFSISANVSHTSELFCQITMYGTHWDHFLHSLPFSVTLNLLCLHELFWYSSITPISSKLLLFWTLMILQETIRKLIMYMFYLTFYISISFSYLDCFNFSGTVCFVLQKGRLRWASQDFNWMGSTWYSPKRVVVQIQKAWERKGRNLALNNNLGTVVSGCLCFKSSFGVQMWSLRPLSPRSQRDTTLILLSFASHTEALHKISLAGNCHPGETAPENALIATHESNISWVSFLAASISTE